jgi:hypothetical protein
MKTLLLSLICLCLSAQTFSQQGSSRQAPRPKKVLPRIKTQQEYLNDVNDLYSVRLCRAAKAAYSFVNSDYQDPQLLKNINKCISTPKASLDDAEEFNPAVDELSALPISINQQVGYENVEFGNEEFAAKRYKNALLFYLQYLKDNYSILRENNDLLDQFEEKIEYCKEQLDLNKTKNKQL